MTETTDIVIIGAGLVGLATARALSHALDHEITVLEAAPHLAPHQSSHNSGVLHAGLYYAPGSLKARLCTRGRLQMVDFCRDHDVPHEICTKVVVATREDELPRLADLHRRAHANGLTDVRRIGPDELRHLEPHAAGIAALHVPYTGIADFPAAAEAMAADARSRAVRILTGAPARAITRDAGHTTVHTPRADIRARHLVACAGLHSDRVARLAGLEPPVRIVPFRGEYHLLRPEARRLVRNLIYPVPDPRLPFLGVHLTRAVDGTVDAGPNAVLALARHGYRWRDVNPRDLAEMIAFPGFWQLLAEHGRHGLGEMWRSISRHAFATAVRRLLPDLRDDDLTPGPAGVRAQAVDPHGRLVHDFVFAEDEGAIHVLNAPSPAATASIAIGEHIADLAIRRFNLTRAQAA